MPTYNADLQSNNNELDDILQKVNDLPPAGGGSYDLPTMSATVKGGAKLGAGLRMDGDVLSATGGGGGDDSGIYELIESVTTTAQARFERYREPNGTPYNFKAFFIKVHPSEGESPSLPFRFEFGSASDYKMILMNTSYTAIAKYLAAEIKPEHGYWTGKISNPANTIHDPLTYQRFLPYESINQIPDSRNLYYFGFPDELPAGTEIEIWAVRA